MSRRIFVVLAPVAITCILAMGLYADDGPGVSISGPSPDQAPAAQANARTATTQVTPAATESSPDSTLNNLLGTPTPTPAPTPAATTAPAFPVTTQPVNPLVVPAASGVAPDQPPVDRLREGQPVWNRIGRLTKNDAGTGYMFVFESDGTTMRDPPMPLLPCRMLEQMEAASDNAAKPMKFKVSGQVTEYHGKNYLLVNYMQPEKDLNKGLD